MAMLDQEQSFERSLERCLQDLERTGDIEACLRRYSQHADRLRPLLEMAQLARHYYKYVPEPPDGLVSGRERLLAAAAQQRARSALKSEAVMQSTKGQRRKLAFAMRFVGVLSAIVLGTVALGGGIAWAANDSLPGDVLYPVKITIEDARLALTSVPNHQVDLLLEFVEERVDEIQRLSATEYSVPGEVIARIERHIEQALTYAAQLPSDEEMVDTLGQIAMRTRTQAELLELMQPTASQQARTMLIQAAAIYRQGSEAAETGLGDPQTFRSRYRHQQGEPESTSEPRVMTITPGNDAEHGQEYQGCDQGRECTPTGTSNMTPQGPQATQSPNTPHAPQPSPWGPQSTPEPQPSPQNPQPTPEPQPTSQNSQPTPEPQPSPQNPQPTPKPQLTPEPQPSPQNPQATPGNPQATSSPQSTPPGSEVQPSPQATPQGTQATPKSNPTPKGP